MSVIINHYNNYSEDERLSKDYQHQTEYFLTKYWIETNLKEGMKILEIGAGTGAYSIELANNGYEVDAVELVPKNLAILKSKIKTNMKINAVLGNALDLSMYEDNSFDIVLCLGPLYHLNEEERKLAIKEAIRVAKKGGYLYFSYISSYLSFVQAIDRFDNYLLNYKDEYDQYYNLYDRNKVFTYLKPYNMEKLMKQYNITKINHVSLDGLTRLIKDKVNNFSKEEFEIWLDYLKKTSEDKSILGYSEHIMFICKKE